MANPQNGVDAESAFQVDFESIRLSPGAPLQIQNLNSASQKYNLRFIGIIKGKSILATLPIVDGMAIRMSQGQSYIIRGLSGKYAYAFTSHVIQARARPFSYVHFSYPLSVECRIVRKALRVSVSLPAFVVVGDEQPVPVTTIDLSAKGSMIASTRPIGEIGDMIKVQFDIVFEEINAKLILPAKIRNAQYSRDATSIHVGVEFEKIPQNDMLILNNFILTTSINA